MTTPDGFDGARDTAQQMVTALLAGDRDLCADIAEEYPMPLVLALVLADLCAFVHVNWTEGTGTGAENRLEEWQALMQGIEEWRVR
jgi:hypothetical protein